MSNFYQKRATLDDMPGNATSSSVDTQNIFRSYEEAVQHSQSFELPHPEQDLHNSEAFRNQNMKKQDDDDAIEDMSFVSVLSKKLVERKSGGPPKIPQMPQFSMGNGENEPKMDVSLQRGFAPELYSHIATMGFPQVIRDVNLGRTKREVPPEESQQEKQRLEHHKILEENLELQRGLERKEREAQKKRNVGGISIVEETPRFGRTQQLPQRAESLEDTKQSVHKENLTQFQSMSSEEIEHMRNELISKLDPTLVKKLQERASKKQTITNQAQRPMKAEYTEEEKLEWTKTVDPNQPSESNETRYDMEGRPVLQEPEEYDRVLYHHGVDQHKAGYTLSEICYLCRSTVPGQKVINLNLLSKIIRHQVGTDPQAYFSDTFYALIDDFQVPLLIIFALKEKNVNIVHAALDALLAFIHFEHNEAWLSAFEQHTLTGLVESPMMTPPMTHTEDEIIEEVPKLKNVTGTAKHDLLKAFVDMDLLDVLFRISSQLSNHASSFTEIPLFITRILSTLVMHSPSTAFAVLEQVLLKKCSSSGSTVLTVLISMNPLEAHQLVELVLRYSSNDSKSLLKDHASIVHDAQVSLAALAAGDWTKTELFEKQNAVLRMLIGKGRVLQQFVPDNFQYISPLLREVFNVKATEQQLHLVADLFDLMEAYCRVNPTDQICHLRIFSESDCMLMMRHLHRVTKHDASSQTGISVSMQLTRLHLFARLNHFYASFYASIVHCSAHKQHTVDSIQRVLNTFTTVEDGLSLVSIMRDQFSSTFGKANLSLPSDFKKMEYPDNLTMYPINLTPDTTQMTHLDVLTSILRLSFFLVQGFPPMKKHVLDSWLAPKLHSMKAQFVNFVKQRSVLYEDNQFILKYSNLSLSNYGSLLLDTHFLIHGPADDSCATNPAQELNFFLCLAYASTNLNVFYECVKRVCHSSYPQIAQVALKTTDNTADWFFAALEKEYLSHGVDQANAATLSESVALLNNLETHAADYLNTFISPMIRLANVIKVLLICGDNLHDHDSLRLELDNFAQRYYFQHFGCPDEHNPNNIKRFISEDSQEFLSTLSEELLNVYCNSSYNHPTFAAYICLFLDSVWPINIQKHILKHVDLFKNVHLSESIGQYFSKLNHFPNDTKFDAQFVDCVLHEFTGLVGCSDRTNPLYIYFTKRTASMLRLSTFYKEQYREELEEYPHLMKDLEIE